MATMQVSFERFNRIKELEDAMKYVQHSHGKFSAVAATAAVGEVSISAKELRMAATLDPVWITKDWDETSRDQFNERLRGITMDYVAAMLRLLEDEAERIVTALKELR